MSLIQWRNKYSSMLIQLDIYLAENNTERFVTPLIGVIKSAI